MFKENAGHMRGFRISRDPNGILFSPFDYMGTQMGYVLTYGEGVPAIHDGEKWVTVIDDATAENYEDNLQNLLMEQATKVAEAATKGEAVYVELAAQMGMFVGAGASGQNSGPDASTVSFGG